MPWFTPPGRSVPDPITTDWAFVPVGAWISDADGKAWRVVERRSKLPAIALGLDDGSGRGVWVTRNAGEDVVLLDMSMDRATALVASVLGGVVEMDVLPQRDSKNARAMWKAHLLHHHHEATVGNQDSLDSLKELHALLHAKPHPSGLPHVHVPVHQMKAYGGSR